MVESIERLWVSALNSNKWRRFAKWGPGSAIFRSRAYRQLDMARRYLATYRQSRKEPRAFQDVTTFCMFIGHTKSGGTLIGSLLDAHPNVILADEVDALRYVAARFSKEQIFHLLLKGSRREAMKGRVTARRLEPYSFLVPGQWQGKYRQLRVIGDSKAGPTTRQLGQAPNLLQQLQNVMTGVNVKLIQVVRNPYDPISLMVIRGKRTFDNAIEHYFAYCETLVKARSHLDSTNLLVLKYEDFICLPEKHLTAICNFLELDARDDYLEACVSILHPSPDQARHRVDWDAHWIAEVKRRMDGIDFLAGYTYER